MISTLPRDGKWEKKRVRAIQQRKGSLDSRSLILAQTPPPPPAPGTLSYPLPLLSLPGQNMITPTGDLFENQQDAADFFMQHHRHHLHLHQQHQHLTDPIEPSDLVFSTLNNNTLGRNPIDYHLLTNNRPSTGFLTNPESKNTTTLSSYQTTCPSAQDSYLFNQSTENACSHCNYELYDCHNNLDLTGSCDLMLLPTSTSYHHLHHHSVYSGAPQFHQCSTSISNNSQQQPSQFNWPGYSDYSINDYHSSRPTSRQQDYNEDQLMAKSTTTVNTMSMNGLIEQQTPIQDLKKSRDQLNAEVQESSNDDKTNQHNEASEEHITRQTGPRLQRTKSFTVEEDLSETA